MQQPLASRYCENLDMRVILCRKDGKDAGQNPAEYRCLSSHLCGRTDCTHEKQDPAAED